MLGLDFVLKYDWYQPFLGSIINKVCMPWPYIAN